MHRAWKRIGVEAMNYQTKSIQEVPSNGHEFSETGEKRAIGFKKKTSDGSKVLVDLSHFRLGIF